MHMSDALLSPTVGGAMWSATAAATIYCSRKLGADPDDRRVPLMGVLGAFIFAAQMINFTIPGTGSSGHLGGGMILAILLGPHAAFLVMASVLSVQALFFADGGLLALGANIFNLGAFPCFLAYPLIYRPLAGGSSSRSRVTPAALLAAVVGLQLGSLGVVTQTVLSGMAELSFASFALLMQPIHLAIGIVEGLVTAAVVSFLLQARPDILPGRPGDGGPGGYSWRRILAGLAVAALLSGGLLSWFASTNPDGLEWSLERLIPAGTEERTGPIHETAERLQEKISVMPDYGSKGSEEGASGPGRSASGVVGGLLTLLLVLGIGWGLRRGGSARSRPPGDRAAS